MRNTLKLSIRNYKTSIAQLIIIFISTFLLLVGAVLLGSAIYEIIENEHDLKDPAAPVGMFGSLLGITIFLSIAIIIINQNVVVKNRFKTYRLLKVMGLSNSRIRMMVFFELLVLVIISSIIAIPSAIPAAKSFLNYFKDKNIMDNKFSIYEKWYFLFIGLGAILIVIAISSYFTTKFIKTIKITGNHKESKKTLAIRLVIGSICLIGSIILVSLKSIMEGGAGVGYIVNAVFLFSIGIGQLGPFGLSLLMKLLAWATKRRYLTSLKFKSISFKSSRIFNISTLLTLMTGFTSYALNINDIYTSSLGFEGKSASAGAQISYVIALIVLIFGFISITNITYIYYLNEKPEIRNLMVNGFSRSGVTYKWIIEILLVSVIAIIFVYIFNIIVIYNFSYANNVIPIYMNNPSIEIPLIFTVLLFPAANIGLFIRLNNNSFK